MSANRNGVSGLLGMIVGLLLLAGCGNGGDSGGGNNDGGDAPAPATPTVVEDSLSSCSPAIADRWRFDVPRGSTVSLSVDTTDPMTAADLCIVGRCGGVDAGGDDELPCDQPPPTFACPRTDVRTRSAGPCTVDVRVCSHACASPSGLDYRLSVAIDGKGPRLRLIADDVDPVDLSLLCIGGANDSEDCTDDDDCENGVCLPLVSVPTRGRATPLPATDVPEDARFACRVSTRMKNEVTYARLKYKIDYNDAAGGFPGEALEVGCDRRTGGFGQFNDHDASRVLAVNLSSGPGISGPRALVDCEFISATFNLTPAAFALVVTEAVDLDDTPIDAGIVLSVHCGSLVTTTSTVPRSSSTTMPPVTTTMMPRLCGEFVAKWGSIGSRPGEFKTAAAVAVDESRGPIYVVDSGNRRIQKFDRDGLFERAWGIRGGGEGQFNGPSDVAVDTAGNVYVADTNNDRIQKFDADGGFLAQWGTRGADDGQFNGPVGVAVARDGSVYVSDRGNTRLQRFDANGGFLLAWGTAGNDPGELGSPEGLAIGPDGDVLVADSLRDRVIRFSAEGEFLAEIGSSGSAPGQLSRPFDVAVRSGGAILVADTGNNRIQQLDRDGSFITEWGGFGRSDGQFDSPRSVATRGATDVFVADAQNHRIQTFRCR